MCKSPKSHKKDVKHRIMHWRKALDNPDAYFRENPDAPVRVLVSTATHLVPDNGYSERSTFIANVVCQRHWDRDFKEGLDRLETRNANFAFDNRTCYFLIGHGRCPNGKEDRVLILWYRWTGTALRIVCQPLSGLVRKKIQRVPFNCWFPSFNPRFTPLERRKHILKCLNRDMELSRFDFYFVRDNPEHARWLQRKLDPKLWTKFKSLEAESREVDEESLSSSIIQSGEPDEPKIPALGAAKEVPNDEALRACLNELS